MTTTSDYAEPSTNAALLTAEVMYLRAALGQARWLLETVPPLMPAKSNHGWLVARDRFLRETR